MRCGGIHRSLPAGPGEETPSAHHGGHGGDRGAGGGADGLIKHGQTPESLCSPAFCFAGDAAEGAGKREFVDLSSPAQQDKNHTHLSLADILAACGGKGAEVGVFRSPERGTLSTATKYPQRRWGHPKPRNESVMDRIWLIQPQKIKSSGDLIRLILLPAIFAAERQGGDHESKSNLFGNVPRSDAGYFLCEQKVTKNSLGDTPNTPK